MDIPSLAHTHAHTNVQTLKFLVLFLHAENERFGIFKFLVLLVKFSRCFDGASHNEP